MNSYLSALKKYAVFSGRASRKDFWMFFLFYFIFGAAALVLDKLLGITLTDEEFGPFFAIYALATAIPLLAIQVRRLHDVGKSGEYILVGLIPLIGGIWLLVLLLSESTPGESKFGPSQKDSMCAMYPKENVYSEKFIMKRAPTVLLVFGYILGVLGGATILFGIAGLVIGLILVLKKGSDAEVTNITYYDEASRKHGKIIATVSIVVTTLSRIIFIYLWTL